MVILIMIREIRVEQVGPLAFSGDLHASNYPTRILGDTLGKCK